MQYINALFNSIYKYAEANATKNSASWDSVIIVAIVCLTVVILSFIVTRCVKSLHTQNVTNEDVKRLEGELKEKQTECDDLKSKLIKESNSDKERRSFVNFCYEMARSNEECHQEIKKDCWKYLKNSYVSNDKIISVSNEEIAQNTPKNETI